MVLLQERLPQYVGQVIHVKHHTQWNKFRNYVENSPILWKNAEMAGETPFWNRFLGETGQGRCE